MQPVVRMLLRSDADGDASDGAAVPLTATDSTDLAFF
jgi:hypothetical protein